MLKRFPHAFQGKSCATIDAVPVTPNGEGTDLAAWLQILGNLHHLVFEFVGLVSISAFALTYLLHIGEGVFDSCIKFESSWRRLNTLRHYSGRLPENRTELATAPNHQISEARPVHPFVERGLLPIQIDLPPRTIRRTPVKHRETFLIETSRRPGNRAKKPRAEAKTRKDGWCYSRM